MLDVQCAPLLTATTGSSAQGGEDGALHPDVPAAITIGAWRLCSRRGSEADQRGRGE